MAEVTHIDEEPRRQRSAQRQALETLRDFERGGVRPLLHIDDAPFILGTISSIASILAAQVNTEKQMADSIMESALEGIALLAALGQFAQEVRA